jgi:hypothetical protein
MKWWPGGQNEGRVGCLAAVSLKCEGSSELDT